MCLGIMLVSRILLGTTKLATNIVMHIHAQTRTDTHPNGHKCM